LADVKVHGVCEAVGVTVDLTGLAERIRLRTADWKSLSVTWTEREISPNYGKESSRRFSVFAAVQEVTLRYAGLNATNAHRARHPQGDR
jgi:hypothetical protein